MVRSRARTCEEFEGRFGLGAHYSDLAKEWESDAVGGLGERFNVTAGSGLGVTELSAGKGQDVEVRRSQLSVELLERPVSCLSLFAVARHVDNKGSLCGAGDVTELSPQKKTH